MKRLLLGVLVLVGIAGSYFAGRLGGGEIPPSRFNTDCATATVIFEQKKRCGFKDLGVLATLKGEVIRIKTHSDGDFSLDVIPDSGYEYLLFFGGQKNRNYIHIEFMPCERVYADVAPLLEIVEVGDKVKITGRWAFDGVDHRGEPEDQLFRCLEGREPDPNLGWVEIHPAYSIELLE